MKFIIGNWKMNGTISEKDDLIQSINKTKTENKIILCLPFTLLGGTTKKLQIGAQNISEHENGAFTGDISAQMITETGAKYVLVGHSDRRLYHHETNKIVQKKAEMAIKHKIIPIICVGETLDEYESGKTETVVTNMLAKCLPSDGEFIIAYEPRWAIGTGKTPTVKQITAIHKMIFDYLSKRGMSKHPILYGGSVNSDNAARFTKISHVDGLLVGGASLKSKTFIPIINAVK